MLSSCISDEHISGNDIFQSPFK